MNYHPPKSVEATRSHMDEASSEPADHKLFTLEQANRALVYIERVVQDIVQAYEDALVLRTRMEAHADQHAEDQYEATMERLADLMEEINATGADITDLCMGSVDFPAMMEGREVVLSWRLGESEVTYWRDIETSQR